MKTINIPDSEPIQKIIFLDFDGVVNNIIWFKDKDGNIKSDYNFPSSLKVNDFQSICWVNELCHQTKADIVISSCWRGKHNHIPNYSAELCLRNAGLADDIKVIGETPILQSRHCRGREIYKWFNINNINPKKIKFVILDDDKDMKPFMHNLVQCKNYHGFGVYEFSIAREMLGDSYNYYTNKINRIYNRIENIIKNIIRKFK